MVSVEDYFDVYGPDDEDRDEEDVQCKFCKRRGFHWQEFYGPNGASRWRLFTDKNRLHDCTPKSSADAFDVVSE